MVDSRRRSIMSVNSPSSSGLPHINQRHFNDLIAALVIIAAAGTAGQAQPSRPSVNSFTNFLVSFKAAVARNDAKAVANMTKLPFLFDSKLRNHNGFQKIYPALFDAKVRACFAKAKPVTEEDRFVIYCGRYIFYFGLDHGEYRFIEFAADPEAGI